jgi:hypothetical protein
VERATVLLRDLLGDFPEQAPLAREVLVCECDGDRIAHDILRRAAEQGRSCPLEMEQAQQLAEVLAAAAARWSPRCSRRGSTRC